MTLSPLKCYLTFLSTLCCITLFAQQHFKNKTGYTIEFGNIKAWAGLIDLQPKEKKVYLFDDNVYKGHSNFALRYLKRNITFSGFKDLVKYPDKRKYIPFNLYDLRDKNLSIDGTPYNWAIKMCDYRFADNPDQMKLLLKNLYFDAQKFLLSEDSLCGKGIILLSNSEAATPNISSAKDLTGAGIPNCSLKEFYKVIDFNPNKTHVLNSGTAYGKLKYIPTSQNEIVPNDAKAIYIFETTPERVPLAAGFITLQPQTFLSHINLLAINRKSPNVSISDKELIAQLKKLNGKSIYLKCERKSNELVFYEAAEIPKSTDKESVQEPEWSLVKPNLFYDSLILLTDSTHNHIALCGAKAAQYAKLQKAFPDFVKPGSAIPFTYYEQIISQAELKNRIDKLDLLPDSCLKEKIKLQSEIRNLILNSPLPKGLLTKIINLRNKYYFGKRIRIRSSTNCEDLPEFNGAGLYTSKGINPDDTPNEIRKKVMTVYASFWSDNACSERNFFGIKNHEASMAILINEAYEGEWANGVALVMPNEIDSTKISLVIDAQPGEHEVTNPKPGDVPEELFFDNIQSENFKMKSRSNYGRVFVSGSITSTCLQQLKKLSMQADNLLKEQMTENQKIKYGTDIEFKILLKNGVYKLYLKQARLLKIY